MKTLISFVCCLSAVCAWAEPTAWRPFSDDSLWNQRIAADTPSDPASEEMIADFASRGPLYVNLRDWSISAYFVDAEKTPKHDVGDSRPGIYGVGFEFPRAIPIPVDAVASPPFHDESDNHLAVIDRDRGLEWGMWAARKDASGRWFTGLGAVTDLKGTGVAPPWYDSPRELDSHRARASGFPLIAGLILVEEIERGRIEHALCFAYDGCRTGVFVPPASTSQVTVPGTRQDRGIPMGGRIQLDPNWDVENSNLSRAGKIIARALQDYGAFCGDYAGANVIYAENSPAAVAAWEGVLSSRDLETIFNPEFIRKHFRVVDMGNVLPGQNFDLAPPYVVEAALADEVRPARIDQLTRTIEVFPLRAAAQQTLRWRAFPQGTKSASGDAASVTIDLRKPQTLELVAPDGRGSTWQVRVAESASVR
ncbi:MAG: hypothetical protein NVV63_07655 [Opitutus sp.]|nr:hypothetical protein [Opitutus sp.]